MSKETRRDVIGFGSVKFEKPVSAWTAVGIVLFGPNDVCCSCGKSCSGRMCDECAEFNAAW